MKNEPSLFFYIKPFLKRFILALFFLTMVAVFTGVFAVIIQPIMDELFLVQGGSTAKLPQQGLALRNFILHQFNLNDSEMVLVLPWLLFLSFLGQAFFTFLSLFMMKTLGLKVVRNIRDYLYKNLVYQSVDFLSRAKTGDLVSRITNDIEKIKSAVSETLAVYVREALTLVVLLFVVFYQDWYMALIALIIFPVAGVLLTFIGKKVKRRGIQSGEALGRLSGFLTETVTGIKIVKAFGMEKHELDKFSKLNQNHYRINSKIALAYSFASPMMHTIGGLVAAIIFAVGMQRISDGHLSPGQFTSFLASLFMMYNPLKRLSSANNDFQQGIAGYDRVMQIIKNKNMTLDKSNATDPGNISGTVEFNNITFGYQKDKPVVENFSLKAEPDKMVALVGSSGAGKTTIMNLLMRFYEVDKGEILVDSMNINDIKIKSLRKSIGLVTQDVFLFNDTIKNNITYGASDYTEEDIKKAAEIARASEFIEKLPEKYNTVTGERGILLSNGQRQRISIARAILRKPAIIIFDEATSSLDSESEKLIQDAMHDVMKGRTTFIIAHRLSTIIDADTILVMKEGKIVENGNHVQLLKKRGLYYSLYNLQFPDMEIIM